MSIDPYKDSVPDIVTWSAEGHPLKVLYSKTVMESMRQAAWEGLQKIPRRGLEIGGVLYGTHRTHELTIIEWRPIECEHAEGPGFELSAKDAAALENTLGQVPADQALRDLVPVGWFHSHTRDGIFLSEADLDIHNRLFPEAWQVALILRPHAYEPTRAGFFVREADGSIRTVSSYETFTLESNRQRLPVGFDPANPRIRMPFRQEDVQTTKPSSHELHTAPARRPAASAEVASPKPPKPEQQQSFQPSQRRSWRRLFLIVVAVCLLASLALVFGLPLLDSGQSDSASLEVLDVEGQLQLKWNRSATPILEAESAVLGILDGGLNSEIKLTAEDLQTGSLTYTRHSGDVEFQLKIIRVNAETSSEIARFLGDEPRRVPASPLEEDLGEIEQLQAEAKNLREQLGEQTARASKLREAIRVQREENNP